MHSRPKKLCVLPILCPSRFDSMAAGNHGAQAAAAQQMQIVPHPFAEVLDKFQEEAMLECDHEFMGLRDFCMSCGQWTSAEHEATDKHARRLVWFKDGQLRKQITWLFDYVDQKKLPKSVLVTTANMMNSVPDNGAIYNAVMNSKQLFTNLHMQAQAEHRGEIWSAPGLERDRQGGDPLVARVDFLEAKCAELETRMLAWGMGVGP